MRKEVQQFAEAMEARLAEFDLSKGVTGWKDALDSILVDLIDTNMSNLDHELQRGRNSITVMMHAVDLANLAMMVADPDRLAEVGTEDMLDADQRGSEQ